MTDIEKYELIKYILTEYYDSAASDDDAITKAMPWFIQTIISTAKSTKMKIRLTDMICRWSLSRFTTRKGTRTDEDTDSL